MKIILTPEDFPKNIKYRLYDTSSRFSVKKLKFYLAKKYTKRYYRNYGLVHKKILSKHCKTSEYIGSVKSPAFRLKENEYIVLYEPDFLKQYDSLISSGVSDSKIIVMPLTVGDPWSFWSLNHMFNLNENGMLDFDKTIKNEYFVKSWENMTSHHLSKKDSIFTHKKEVSDLGVSFPIPREDFRKSSAIEPFPFVSSYSHLTSESKNTIEFIANNLSDQKSREVYLGVFEKKAADVFAHYFSNSLRNLQYFEYLKINKGDNIINVGVDNGFEIPIFSALMQDNGTIYNIDPSGFERLSSYCQEFLSNSPKANVIENKYYLSGFSGASYVDENTFEVSALQKEGMVKADFITIDDFAKNENIKKLDVIKMDIEGAEIDSVPQLIETTKKLRPQLAIAIYHKLDHLWKIPETLINSLEDYNFYFNIYSYSCYEAVFYAIPKEKDND